MVKNKFQVWASILSQKNLECFQSLFKYLVWLSGYGQKRLPRRLPHHKPFEITDFEKGLK